MDECAFEDLGVLMSLGPDEYKRRVITLFLTHRATPEQYLAMAEAVLRCSQSAEGQIVAAIDVAIARR